MKCLIFILVVFRFIKATTLQYHAVSATLLLLNCYWHLRESARKQHIASTLRLLSLVCILPLFPKIVISWRTVSITISKQDLTEKLAENVLKNTEKHHDVNGWCKSKLTSFMIVILCLRYCGLQFDDVHLGN